MKFVLSRRGGGECGDPGGTGRSAARPKPGPLDQVLGGKAMLEDLRPLAESLDWQLGQLYWQRMGRRAFLSGKVPYKIINDGNLSLKAARLLWASVQAADQAGALEENIRVLEVGAGLGLFARFFLDAFRRLATASGTDYYDRLTYVLTDRSSPMLADIEREGLLSGHPGRWELRLEDALPQPGPASNAERFRAVHLNYVLDSLPVSLVRIADGRWSRLEVRTSIGRGLPLRRHTELSLEELRARAASTQAADREPLIDLYPLFALDLEYRPCRAEDVPQAGTALRCAADAAGVRLHNHGALDCLESMRHRLGPGGYVLVNDYDDPPFDERLGSYRHQRFGGSTAMGINPRLLACHFEGRADCLWIAPPGDNRHLCSRLLAAPDLAPATRACFLDRFSQAAYDWHFGPIEAARKCLRAERRESALAAFSQALERQPDNWALLTEVADFVMFTLGDPASALELTRRGLALNPVSPDLWNTQGDCLYALGRHDAAHAAFLRALELNPDDVRARYNLSFTHLEWHEHPQALRLIAEALGLDRKGRFRERLLQQQSEVLRRLSGRWQEADRNYRDRFGSTGGDQRGHGVTDAGPGED